MKTFIVAESKKIAGVASPAGLPTSPRFSLQASIARRKRLPRMPL
jgi:hypothetical protein